MNVSVLSREDIFIDGIRVKSKKLKLKRMSHLREVRRHENIIIKIDSPDDGQTWNQCYGLDELRQSKREMRLWKRMLPSEKRFFAEPIGFGYFKEDGYKVHWVAEMYLEKTKKEIYKHKDWDKFEKIIYKYDLCDIEPRNCFVEKYTGNLICIDWGM